MEDLLKKFLLILDVIKFYLFICYQIKKMNSLKITPFLIVFGIIEIILVCLAFNYLFIDNKGGMALAGTMATIGAVINMIILTIEQIIANNITNSKLLWLIEIIIITLLTVYFSINGITFW